MENRYKKFSRLLFNRMKTREESESEYSKPNKVHIEPDVRQIRIHKKSTESIQPTDDSFQNYQDLRVSISK